MRITAGLFKGRNITNKRSAKSHPMSDRIKNALFNALGDISGLTVLDAFGGSGALGFESLSRGASRVTICEIDKKAFSSMKQNAQILKVANKLKLINRNVYSFIKDIDEKFDLIIIDPPFSEFENLKIEEFSSVLKQASIMVISHPSRVTISNYPKLELLRHNKYGDAALSFYRFQRS